MRRSPFLASFTAVALASALAAAAPAPAHYEALTPRWTARIGHTIQSLLPGLRKTKGRARAVALAEAHDRYLGESHMTIGDAILHAASSAPSTVKNLEFLGNRVIGEPSVGGREIGERLERFIASAKSEVSIESYVYEKSWLATKVRNGIERLPENVEVRALAHPRGSFGFGLFGLHRLWQGLTLKKLLPSRVTLGTYRVPDLFGLSSLHDKGVVVDSQRAFVTDSNIQRTVDPAAEGGGDWFQLGLEIEGPIASAIRDDHLAAWRRSYPDAELPDASTPSKPKGDVRMIYLAKQSSSGGRSSANLGLAALFLSARKKVRVITPNLNDDAAVLALAAATAHSDVEIVLSKGFNEVSEWLGQGGGNARNVNRLRDMAVDRSRLHIRWFTREDGKVPVGNGFGPSHAKYASADGKVMVLGSQNLDTQSWKNSREAGVAVEDEATTGKFDAVFDQVFERGAIAYEPGAR